MAGEYGFFNLPVSATAESLRRGHLLFEFSRWGPALRRDMRDVTLLLHCLYAALSAHVDVCSCIYGASAEHCPV